MSKMDVLPMLTVKIAIKQEDYKFVSSVSLLLIESYLFLNTLVSVDKVSINQQALACLVRVVVLSAPVLQFVRDVLFLPQTIKTDHAHALKAISLPLNQLDIAKDAMITV